MQRETFRGLLLVLLLVRDGGVAVVVADAVVGVAWHALGRVGGCLVVYHSLLKLTQTRPFQLLLTKLFQNSFC